MTFAQRTEAGDIDDLDLREANVTAVELERTGGNGYRFTVTLIHDDAGEEGYADHRQVEAPDGSRLGRRELLPAHGYGGQTAVVDLETGAIHLIRQGSEPRDLPD